MGVETALGIGAGAGALGGAIKGGKGTPDQIQTQTTEIAPAGAQEQALQQASLSNYNQAQQLAGQYEKGVAGTQGYQDLARQAGQNILSGQALQITPQEQQQIQDLRSALLAQSQYDINNQLDRRLQMAKEDAANRGLRGQAMGSLQGQVLQGGAQALGQATLDVNRIAAQAAMEQPYRRVGAQSGFIQSGLTLADQLRQQAVQNRMALQNPALMQSLYNERIAGATRTGVTPGEQGGFWNAVTGGLSGGLGGANIGANIYGALNDRKPKTK